MKQTAKQSPPRPAWLARTAVIGVALALTVTAASAQFNKAELIPFWDASDESSDQRVDHGPWQDLLDAHLRADSAGVSRFDYKGLKAASENLKKLGAYLRSLQNLDPRKLSRVEQKAYWLNFYNALTVKIVADNYPVESIRDIRSKRWLAGLVFPGPWDDVYAKVAGQDLTLNNIENGILRPIWDDNRVHYGVNCASFSCPNLASLAFTAENTEGLLESGARAYVNDPRGVDFVDEDFIVISSIYDWFEEDFGGSEEGVMEHLLRYAEDDLLEDLKAFEGAIDYEYDWTLNSP